MKFNKIYERYIEILNEELLPAMGCTEPASIAYGAARAKEILGEFPEQVIVKASGNLIKNVKSVRIPNTGDLYGIKAAVAAGIIKGESKHKLEILSSINLEEKKEIIKFINKDIIEVNLLESEYPFDLIIKVKSKNHSAKIQISHNHTNIIKEEKNGVNLLPSKVNVDLKKANKYGLLNLRDIFDFAQSVEISDIYDVINRQINYNTAIAKEGLKNDYGANIGKILLKMYGDDVRTRAKAKAAAASDARMSGSELPVIINSGSGNQGITLSIPVIEYAKELEVGEEKMYRALILANLIAIHVKSSMGSLSAYCGAVSAASASGAAISYLDGGDYNNIGSSLINSLAITSGIICDGAKPSCAAKIASSIDSAILGYEMQKKGDNFYPGQGIIGKDFEDTILNVARIGKDGMKCTDKEILKIMTGQ